MVGSYGRVRNVFLNQTVFSVVIQALPRFLILPVRSNSPSASETLSTPITPGTPNTLNTSDALDAIAGTYSLSICFSIGGAG